MNKFGNLTRIEDIRLHWKNEAWDFTRWLAERIDLLSSALDLDLDIASTQTETEKRVGPFRADIVCRVANDPDRLVLVENQIERTDHLHLGQLLTYAAGLDAVTIVWIAKQFSEEHRAALDWLNQHTDEHLEFYGAEIELWQIDGSLPAPRFNIVSRPNEVTRGSRTAASAATSSRQLEQIAFWDACRAYGAEHGRKFVPGTSPRANWTAFSAGRAGIQLAMVAARNDPRSLHQADHLRIELTFNGPNARFYFEQMQGHRAEIDTVLGDTEWYEVEDVTQRRIYRWKAAPVSQSEQWPGQFQWLYDTIEQFDKVLRPFVTALPLPQPDASLSA